nr:hypothetical protein [Nocardioides ochotonae]
MEGLNRPDLWEILELALEPAREAGRAYVASGKYMEKEDARKYHESATGWPLVTADRIFADGGPKWSTLFSTKPGQFSKVLVADVPELKSAVAWPVAGTNAGSSTSMSTEAYTGPRPRQSQTSSSTILGVERFEKVSARMMLKPAHASSSSSPAW